MSRTTMQGATGRRPGTRGYTVSAAVAALAVLALAANAWADEPPSRPVPQRQAPSGAAFLEKIWPEHPEWLAMLVDIFVKGDQMSGDDGWFRKGKMQTRFDWKSTRARFDKDGDGSVSRAEFPGTAADFARLDRNRDSKLNAADFDFATSPPGAALGSQLFREVDRDANGNVTRGEFDAFFEGVDSGAVGFVSLDEFRQVFDVPPMTLHQATVGPRGLTRETFLKCFIRRELGPFAPGPRLDEPAPDFTLRTDDGRESVTLSKVVGAKPVVLVFGNFTCAPFRGQAGNLKKLHHRYKDRATFLLVYVREAHPTDGWRMVPNDRAGISLAQPRTYDERAGVAQTCNRSLGLSFPVLVDTIDDTVNNRYCGLPSRLYVIDQRGKIAYRSGRGPFGFKPAEMEHSLVLLLQNEATSTTTAHAGASAANPEEEKK
jgi:Iodothyronine deiodinase/EF hand